MFNEFTAISRGRNYYSRKKHTDPSLFYEVSYLQDNRVLYGDLTGADHLNFICHAQKLPARKAKEVAAYVGMDKYAKKSA